VLVENKTETQLVVTPTAQPGSSVDLLRELIWGRFLLRFLDVAQVDESELFYNLLDATGRDPHFVFWFTDIFHSFDCTIREKLEGFRALFFIRVWFLQTQAHLPMKKVNVQSSGFPFHRVLFLMDFKKFPIKRWFSLTFPLDDSFELQGLNGQLNPRNQPAQGPNDPCRVLEHGWVASVFQQRQQHWPDLIWSFFDIISISTFRRLTNL